jgi:hypothetical protein
MGKNPKPVNIQCQILLLLLLLLLFYTRLCNGTCNYKYEDILVRLHFLTLHLRMRYLNALFLINIFKGKISLSSVLDTVSLAYPLDLSETTLLLLWIIISRSDPPQPHVFLLPMQSVGALTSLTKILFCILILVSFLNKIFSFFTSPFCF